MAAQHLPRNLARPSNGSKKNSLKRKKYKTRFKCVDSLICSFLPQFSVTEGRGALFVKEQIRVSKCCSCLAYFALPHSDVAKIYVWGELEVQRCEFRNMQVK